IFVPAMVSPLSEPMYAVFNQEGELIGQQNMSSSFFVPPGKYRVVIGSGALEQRIIKEIQIDREQTVIIEPDWAALTIEVIDESRNWVLQDFQIYNLETTLSVGIIPAINPELGEQVPTLILPPGRYKIVKRGDDFNTYINFATVSLEPSVYTPFTIVIESGSKNFAGAGIQQPISKSAQLHNWRTYAILNGNFVLNSDNQSEKRLKTDLALFTQFETRLIYDQFPHNYQGKGLLELGTQKLRESRFTIKPDRFQLKNTYIYFLEKWIGGYFRLDCLTHLFPTKELYPKKRWLYRYNKDRMLIDSLETDQFTVQPAFYPLELKEGLGLNLTPISTYRVKLSLRGGFGFRQSFNQGVYREDLPGRFYRVSDQFQKGFETSILSFFALPLNISVTSELDALFPIESQSEVVIDFSNHTSWLLTKRVSLDHILRVKRDRTLYSYNRVEQLVSIRLSYYLF
ncbi:MAG: hypothetical protein ACK4OO_05525, partial [bacterium]